MDFDGSNENDESNNSNSITRSGSKINRRISIPLSLKNNFRSSHEAARGIGNPVISYCLHYDVALISQSQKRILCITERDVGLPAEISLVLVGFLIRK